MKNSYICKQIYTECIIIKESTTMITRKMKKTIVILALLAWCGVAAQSAILRVSNVVGSTALYSSIDEAIMKANEGDTIMVDGSATSYGPVSVGKRVVLMGPGYFLNENGICLSSPGPARLQDVEMGASGIIMQGLTVEGRVDVTAPRCVITRCRIDGTIQLWGPHEEGKSGNAVNCVIHQNFLNGRVLGDYEVGYIPTITGIQITNNIFNGPIDVYRGSICDMTESRIENNTWTNKEEFPVLRSIFNSTINNNIFPLAEADASDVDGREYANTTNLYNARNNNVFLFESRWNLKSWEWENLVSPFQGHTDTDLAVKAVEDELFQDNVGAFSGDDSYVISGIPTGPVVENLVIPATVRKGETMNVEVKIGLTR